MIQLILYEVHAFFNSIINDLVIHIAPSRSFKILVLIIHKSYTYAKDQKKLEYKQMFKLNHWF